MTETSLELDEDDEVAEVVEECKEEPLAAEMEAESLEEASEPDEAANPVLTHESASSSTGCDIL